MNWIDLIDDWARGRMFSDVYMFCFRKPREIFELRCGTATVSIITLLSEFI